MPEPTTSITTRAFNRTDLKRTLILSVIFWPLVAGCWFVLPLLQSKVIPSAPGGTIGPWVLQPILAMRFGATAVLGCLTFMLLARPLFAKWKREDAALGSRYDPHAGQPIKRGAMWLKITLLFIVYASGLVFYLLSWHTVGPHGIEIRLPWTTRHYSFEEIATLETIPDGERSDLIRENGPWYSVTFQSGRSLSWSLDNEGITRVELEAIADFVSRRSGLSWERRSDARVR